LLLLLLLLLPLLLLSSAVFCLKKLLQLVGKAQRLPCLCSRLFERGPRQPVGAVAWHTGRGPRRA